MSRKFTIPARTVVGFGDRRFFIFPNEITVFLVHCNDIGLCNARDIAADLQDIADIVVDSNLCDAEQLKKHLKLIRELTTMMNGAIQESS